MTTPYFIGQRVSLVQNDKQVFGTVIAHGDPLTYDILTDSGKRVWRDHGALSDAEGRAPKPPGYIGRTITVNGRFATVTGRCFALQGKHLLLRDREGKVWTVAPPVAPKKKKVPASVALRWIAAPLRAYYRLSPRGAGL